MGGHSWRFASDDETRAFRKRPKKSRGFFAGKDIHGIFEVSSRSTVRDRDGDTHMVAPGERVKVLTPTRSRDTRIRNGSYSRKRFTSATDRV